MYINLPFRKVWMVLVLEAASDGAVLGAGGLAGLRQLNFNS